MIGHAHAHAHTSILFLLFESGRYLYTVSPLGFFTDRLPKIDAPPKNALGGRVPVLYLSTRVPTWARIELGGYHFVARDEVRQLSRF